MPKNKKTKEKKIINIAVPVCSLYLFDVCSAFLAFGDIFGLLSQLFLPFRGKKELIHLCWSHSLNASHLETSTVSDSRARTQNRPLLSHLVEMLPFICSRHWNWSVNTTTRYAVDCQRSNRFYFFMIGIFESSNAKLIIVSVVNCLLQCAFVISEDQVRAPFALPGQNNTRPLRGWKDEVLVYPCMFIIRSLVETCDLEHHKIKICFPCFRKYI